jgi:hypothetical protein
VRSWISNPRRVTQSGSIVIKQVIEHKLGQSLCIVLASLRKRYDLIDDDPRHRVKLNALVCDLQRTTMDKK